MRLLPILLTASCAPAVSFQASPVTSRPRNHPLTVIAPGGERAVGGALDFPLRSTTAVHIGTFTR